MGINYWICSTSLIISELYSSAFFYFVFFNSTEAMHSSLGMHPQQFTALLLPIYVVTSAFLE